MSGGVAIFYILSALLVASCFVCNNGPMAPVHASLARECHGVPAREWKKYCTELREHANMK